VRDEKVSIISDFSHFVSGDGKAITKEKGQSPAFHSTRTRNTKPNCSWLQ
jgi:hypothetical protein